MSSNFKITNLIKLYIRSAFSKQNKKLNSVIKQSNTNYTIENLSDLRLVTGYTNPNPNHLSFSNHVFAIFLTLFLQSDQQKVWACSQLCFHQIFTCVGGNQHKLCIFSRLWLFLKTESALLMHNTHSS